MEWQVWIQNYRNYAQGSGDSVVQPGFLVYLLSVPGMAPGISMPDQPWAPSRAPSQRLSRHVGISILARAGSLVFYWTVGPQPVPTSCSPLWLCGFSCPQGSCHHLWKPAEGGSCFNGPTDSAPGLQTTFQMPALTGLYALGHLCYI